MYIYFVVFVSERKADFYSMNVMMPIVLVSVMVVFVFLVPAESGEKITYVLTVFLSLAVLLTIVMDSLPRTSKSISVLGMISHFVTSSPSYYSH